MKTYIVGQKLVNLGFGVIALTPAIIGNKATGKIPSSRSSKFTDLDEIGNPTPLLNDDGTIKKTKFGQTEYAVAYGGSKNPILLTDDNWETQLYKTFCDKSYTDRNIDGLGIGIVTGQTGQVVIDIDGAKGHEQWEALKRKYGDVPETLSATTGRQDGQHLVFKTPMVDGKYIEMGSKVKFLAPEVDYKGDYGYIAVEDTLHHSGNHYSWDKPIDNVVLDDLPELPDWIVVLLFSSQWHSRDDGLFEDEKVEHWATHKKQKQQIDALTKEVQKNSDFMPTTTVCGSGFYCRIKDTDTFFHMDGSEVSDTQYCDCPMHHSESQKSLHIDWKGDHYEWNCFGCTVGGKAYTSDEYAQYIHTRDYFKGLENWISSGADDEIDFDWEDTPSVTATEEAAPEVYPSIDVSDTDSIIDMPDGDNNINLEQFGDVLGKFKYKNTYLPKCMSDYIDGSDGGREEIKPTLLLGLLANFSNLLGTNYKIKVNPNSNWKEPTLIWGASPGKSGAIKSGLKTIVDLPFTPIYDLMKTKDKVTEGELKRLTAIYNKKYKLWEANPDSENTNPPPAPNKHDFAKNYNQVEDSTLASMQDDAEICHRGLFIYADELMSVFDSFNTLQKGAGNYFQKSLLKSYDSIDDYNLGRATKKRDIPRWHNSIYGFCVTKDFRENMLDTKNRSDGWSARFLVSLLPHGKVGNNYGVNAMADIDILSSTAKSMFWVEPQYDKDTTRIKYKTMTFTDKAQKFWINFDHQRAAMMNRCPKVRSSFYESTFQKMIGQAARLTAIIHLIKFHSKQYPGLEELIVDLDSVKAGCYWAMYFHKNIFELYFTIDDDDLGSDEQKVMNSCVKYQKNYRKFKTMKDLMSGLRMKAPRLKVACDGLVEKEKAIYADGGKMIVVDNNS